MTKIYLIHLVRFLLLLQWLGTVGEQVCVCECVCVYVKVWDQDLFQISVLTELKLKDHFWFVFVWVFFLLLLSAQSIVVFAASLRTTILYTLSLKLLSEVSRRAVARSSSMPSSEPAKANDLECFTATIKAICQKKLTFFLFFTQYLAVLFSHFTNKTKIFRLISKAWSKTSTISSGWSRSYTFTTDVFSPQYLLKYC